jgi:type II restriction enzyme
MTIKENLKRNGVQRANLSEHIVDDNNLTCAMKDVCQYLNDKYFVINRDYTVSFEPKIPNSKRYEYLINRGCNKKDISYLIKGSRDFSIRPDGGILYLNDEKNVKFYPLLSSEIKYQGTNDERIKQGKKRQSMGNACDREGKNFNVIREFFSRETILPYIIFGWGCDFREEYILNKFRCITSENINKLNIYKNSMGNASNVLIKDNAERWSYFEMYSNLKKAGEESLQYYINNLEI